MNRRIRFLLASGVLAIAGLSPMHAEKTVKVTYAQGDGDRLPLTTATRISFLAEGIEVANADAETVSIPYSLIQSISFEDTGLSVDRVVNSEGLRIRRNPVEGILEIAGHSGAASRLSISSLGGIRMFSASSWKGEAIDVSSFAPGLYLLTIDNITIKFIKK